MKKKIFLISLVLIIMLIVPFVSAGFFKDFFNMITGRVTVNVTNETETKPECTESDGGIDYYTKGSVTDFTGTHWDSCQNTNYIDEYHCYYNTEMNRYEARHDVVLCPNGYICQDGVCVESLSPECIKEGEPYERGGGKQCCEGLKAISASVGDGRVCSLTAGYYCSPCGNGVCEGRENTCNCPEDCPCEEGKTYSYTCRDGTEVPMCKCSNGEWVCVTAPGNQCPKQVCGNEICEGDETETCQQDCGCTCPDIVEPVCGRNNKTYKNSCEATCVGAYIACSGACPCPVCGNGICESNEESYCLEDCKKEVEVCVDRCGDGTCDKIVCVGTGCPCAETEVSCPKDCKKLEGACKDSLDCPTKMKCENSVCVDVGCIKEGETGPSAGISPEWYDHLPTECCEGLKLITYPRNYDENCNFVALVGGPSGICTRCGDGQCGKGETKCNCPDDCILELPAPQPTPVPSGCKRIIRDDGMEVIVCEKECPPLPEEAIKKCEETGGNAVRRFDPQGCPFIDCEYAARPVTFVSVTCPSEDELREMKEKCLNIGLEPISVREGRCEYIRCSEKPREVKRCAEDIEVVKKIKEACEIKGGRIVKEFDSMGCPITVCAPPEEEFDCARDIPNEAHENCELEGGDLVVKRDDKGCIRFIECVRRGNVDIIYEEIEEIPPAAKLLSIALKLETLKIEFDKLIKKLKDIANYYDGIGNTAEAEKFRKVLGLFSNANDKIEAIKVKIRESAGSMTEEKLRDIKHDIKYISEVVMQDALYIILGGEIEIEGSVGVTEEGYTDCGSDSRCWQEALRLCEPAVVKPNEGVFFKIEGLKKELCVIELTYGDARVVCKIKDYATLRSEGGDVSQYCEGDINMLRATITTRTKSITQEDCEKMTDSDQKDNCYIQIAINTKDISICEKITDRKDRCYGEVAVRTKDVSVCEKMTDSDGKERCYSGFAMATNDISLCEKITNIDIKDGCYIEIAVKRGDSSLCPGSGQTSCYTRIAINTKDSSHCEKMTEGDEKTKCYAVATNDSSLCEGITDIGPRDTCYILIAEETKDSSLCEKMTLSHMRDECYEEIGGGVS